MSAISPTCTPVARTSCAPGPRVRQPGLDLARFVAACAIIWLHAPHITYWENSRALGRFAVPFFVMVTILMVFESIVRNPQQRFRPYAWSRFVRLYMPFMVWNGIYIGFKLLKGRLLPGEPNDYPGIEIFWAGACWHLWFLPFILVVSLVAFWVARLVYLRPDFAPSLALGSLLTGWLLMFFPSGKLLADISEYCEIVGNALPAVAWGLGLAITCQVLGSAQLKRPVATVLGGALLILGIAYVWHFGRSRASETFAGLGMLIVAMAPVERLWCQSLARLGRLTYGVYLCHVLWLKVIEVLVMKIGAANGWRSDIAVFLATLLASSVTAWALSRRRFTRWLVV